MNEGSAKRRWFRFSLAMMLLLICRTPTLSNERGLMSVESPRTPRFPETEYANALEKKMIGGIAAYPENLERIKDCLSKGARVDARHGDGFHAIHGRHLTGSSNWTALMAAIHRGHISIAKFLISRDASVTVDDGWGWTPLLMLANKSVQKKEYDELAALLLEKGADPRAKGRVFVHGDTTVLHEAVRNGHYEIVKMLIAAGVDVNVTTKDGRTALDRAYRRHPKIQELLLKAGAVKSASKKEPEN